MADSEDNQLDELSKKTLGSYIKKASLGNTQGGMMATSNDKKRAGDGVKLIIKRTNGIAKAADKLAKEEVEQVDELSRKTLGSYVKKASGQIHTTAKQMGREEGEGGDSYDKAWNKNYNRKAGVRKAADKLAKEEVEQVDEVSHDKLKKYMDKADDSANAAKKARNAGDDSARKTIAKREKGVGTAMKKIFGDAKVNSSFKEEAEDDVTLDQIDELSKKTLGSYIKNAAGEISSSGKAKGWAMAHNLGGLGPNAGMEHSKNIIKRRKGIKMATDKLTKEEVEMTGEVNETAAADTLKPGSRVAMATAIAQAISNMDTPAQVDFFNKMLAQIGHEADGVKGGAQATLKPGSSPVKEDVADLFKEDGVELTEEFKEKAATLFEAALSLRTQEIEDKLTEAYEAKLVETLAEELGAVTEKLDKYLDYVADKWLEENEVAVASGLRAQVVESFMTGLKDLFADHYIDIPDEAVDVVEQLQSEVEALKNRLNESEKAQAELRDTIAEATKEMVKDEVAEGLTLIQKDKFNTLVEGVGFSDEASYRRSLESIKGKFMTESKVAAQPGAGILTEQAEPIVEEKQVIAEMKPYIDAIRRTNTAR